LAEPIKVYKTLISLYYRAEAEHLGSFVVEVGMLKVRTGFGPGLCRSGHPGGVSVHGSRVTNVQMTIEPRTLREQGFAVERAKVVGRSLRQAGAF
jgi:hypothetical protein